MQKKYSRKSESSGCRQCRSIRSAKPEAPGKQEKEERKAEDEKIFLFWYGRKIVLPRSTIDRRAEKGSTGDEGGKGREAGITRRPWTRRGRGECESVRRNGNRMVGVRVGVRNRLGEAIGKPVANLRGRWTSTKEESGENGQKRPGGSLRFSAKLTQTYPPADFHSFLLGTTEDKITRRSVDAIANCEPLGSDRVERN